MRRLSVFAAAVIMAACTSPAFAERANYRIHMSVVGNCAEAFEADGGLHQVAPIDEGTTCTVSITVTPRTEYSKRVISQFDVSLGAVLAKPRFKQLGRAALKSGAARIRFKWSEGYCFVSPRITSKRPGGAVVGETRGEAIVSLALQNGECFGGVKNG